ncbi:MULTISPECIES: zinc-binding dehydrogenase [Cytobacillus]|uniref:Alcohol dehydrogenase catalytic domain-containing protein n=1 Tax=Cytobacillus stercorigallinarum TaxID=2762240 RepID=A0ABR8QLB7_9BACI|nr:alcohol dehydrogenase catalytic domain-containing protein [Cytobacillus stercorigallinarum]MBD7936317.1 alcohol dehydrogenase catalytic domain-containing protein [Cytobacillus stercorigallinarum]
MKALVIEGIKNAIVQEVPDPTIDENGVIVKVKANGVCRSDWHYWAGDIPITQKILGHEFTGVVEEVGKNVKNYKKGDRVIVPFSGSDGTCPYCLQGHSNLCHSSYIPGSTYNGGYAEYVGVPLGDRNIIPLAEEISFLDGAALGCRLMTAFHGVVDRAKVEPGEWVVIYGCGGVGLNAINIAASIGATVIGVDINPKNLELAKQMGAHVVINSKEVDPVHAVKEITGGGANVSIDALGIADTCLNGIHSLAKRGRHLQVGVTTKVEDGKIALPIDQMVMQEIQFIGTLGMPNHRFDSLLPLVLQGKITPGKMVTAEISLSEVTKIFEEMSNYNTSGTYIVTEFEKSTVTA